jgi:glycerol uptake facilitator-like aquaporin
VYEELMFTATGPGGAFGLYAPAGYNMGTLFLNEFVVDFTIATVIFACVDPTNLLVPPSSAPWIIGLT